MNHVIKVLGPPGTGKTTHLMEEMEKQLAKGVRPVEIGFMTFTKKAAQEATERACVKFGYGPKDLTYFRTIHSLAYTMLGLRHGELVQRSHLQDLGKKVGLKLTGRVDLDDDTLGGLAGDRILFLENLARIRKIGLREVWEEQNDQELRWDTFSRVCREYTSYKQAKSILDFTDILARYAAYPVKPRFKVLFIDEAQDLSPLQWDLVHQLMANSELTVIAGDDDQAIFEWAGADVNQFIDLKADETRVLEQSYRIPGEVHDLALLVADRINNRLEKDFKPRAETGRLDFHSDLNQVEMSSGEWLLLCRNRHQLKMLEEHCRERYMPYESSGPTPLKSEQLTAIRLWERQRKGDPISDEEADLLKKYSHAKAAKTLPWYQALTRIGTADVSYYRGLRARGESLFNKPRVRISTIHGAKGGEADNVVLLTDLASRNEEGMRRNPDQEHRVFYVGVTRAKQALHVIRPMTNLGYKL